VLLRSDKGIANFSDRSLLKNLGHWLGMLTLAKSKPILQVDIDLKSLLAEAYHKGQQELLYVVPFVAKVLESCSKSKVWYVFSDLIKCVRMGILLLCVRVCSQKKVIPGKCWDGISIKLQLFYSKSFACH
jgi:hypothetical protein